MGSPRNAKEDVPGPPAKSEAHPLISNRASHAAQSGKVYKTSSFFFLLLHAYIYINLGEDPFAGARGNELVASHEVRRVQPGNGFGLLARKACVFEPLDAA
jgi:hypothetical protein